MLPNTRQLLHDVFWYHGRWWWILFAAFWFALGLLLAPSPLGAACFVISAMGLVYS